MNYTVRTILPEELEKLNPLFMARDQARFLRERAAHIVDRVTDTYVVEQGDQFIAELTIFYHKGDGADYTIPNRRVYMEAFRVLPAYQGQGVGQYLLARVIEQVKAQGFSEMTVGVEDENKNAGHIYAKFGFTEFVRRDHGDEYDPCDYNVYLKRL